MKMEINEKGTFETVIRLLLKRENIELRLFTVGNL